MTIPTGLVKSTTQASGSARRAHLVGDVQHDRDGAQRLGETPWSGRLLADHAALVGQRLVDQRASWPPIRSWTSTADGAVDRRGPVGRRHHPTGEPGPARMRSASPPRPPVARAVDVEQHQLVDGQGVGAAGEALDELRGVRAPAADHGDLHRAIISSPLAPAHGDPLDEHLLREMNSSSTGSMNIRDAAICSWYADWWALLDACQADREGLPAGLFPLYSSGL